MKKHSTCYKLLFLLLGLMYAQPGQAQQPAQRNITVEISNRQLNGSVYTADIIIIVKPHLTWIVDECAFYVEYNYSALNQTGYIGQNLLNIDPALATDYIAYQSVVTRNGNVIPGIVRVELEHIAGRPYTTKTAGSTNLIVPIGTIRWNVTGTEALDDVFLISSRLPFLPKVQYYDPITKMGVVYEENQIHVPPTPSIPINRSGCSFQFYAPPQNCNETEVPVGTLTPIPENCQRWPQRAGPGMQPAVARFQYDFNPAWAPNGWQAQDFDYGDIAPLLDVARCRWEKQIDSPGLNMFDWETTTTGGRLYFTVFPEDISIHPLGVLGAAAVTYVARDPNGLSASRDSSQCGPKGTAHSFKRRSEVVFNNCAAFHAMNPHRHWTTNTGGSCSNDFCYDFFSIAQHELGHYIGLAHELRNPDATMFAETIWPMPTNLLQCDADNARRLYNPTLVNTPPDNTTCAIPTSVEETAVSRVEETFSVYPSPNHGDVCTVKYSVSRDAFVRIFVTDLSGNHVLPAIEKQRDAGMYQSAFSTEALQSGTYMVILRIDGEQLTQKLVIVR